MPAPYPPPSLATHCCLGFRIQVVHAGFLKNPELRLPGQSPSPRADQRGSQTAAFAAHVSSVSCSVRKETACSGGDTDTAGLRGEAALLWKGAQIATRWPRWLEVSAFISCLFPFMGCCLKPYPLKWCYYFVELL